MENEKNKYRFLKKAAMHYVADNKNYNLDKIWGTRRKRD